MAESGFEKLKYGLLKIIDVSGFKVFDPVERLCFGEEPKKQTVDILKFLMTPIVVVFLCLGLWNVIASRHKTNSGEVPSPAHAWEAAAINQTLHARENEKGRDFRATGQQREDTIAEVTALLEAKRIESENLKKQLADIRATTLSQKQLVVEPLQQKAGELLALLQIDKTLKEQEREAEKQLNDDIKEASEGPQEVKSAEMTSDSAANEVQHLSKRLDYLQTGNRELKTDKATAATTAAINKLSASRTPKAILAAAKSVVPGEERAEKTAEQTYPRRATIWLQVKRSLFTVFVGFVLAAAIAIPVAIMCGLNKVVMACLTPLISIFKPVSPVVWLLIFQIVVGAFFLLDPESYWLLELCDNLWFIDDLAVNPALVFSACTAAMCAVWPALVNTALGVSSIDQDHLNIAKVLRLGLWSRLFKIVIPSSLPLVFAGLRISLGVGWMALIAAEALSSSEGLGKYVWDEYQNGSSQSFTNIIFACFLVGIIGFILDRIMILLQRSVSFDDGAAVV